MMIEEIVREELEDVLNVRIYLDLPEDLPEEFVYLDKTSDEATDFINTAMFSARSYAATAIDAGYLSRRVKYAMQRLVRRDDIAGVRLNSESDYPDTQRKRARYQATFEITYYDDLKED